MTGIIMKGIGGFYYVYVEGAGLYECRAKGIFRNKKQKPKVGDTVDIDVISEADKTGNLVAIHPRKNEVLRPVVANVDQALVIFAIKDPEPNINLLNRYLIMMEKEEIPVIICFNKADLATEEERERLRKDYAGCGCKVVFTSIRENLGLEELKADLAGKVTVLAGPSGVGKSSTVNYISSDMKMQTGELSEKIKRGKNTTRHSELIRIDHDSYLVDTPGFSSLYIENIEKEDLRFYFPEFADYENCCRFNGCVHVYEPDCKVKADVEAGLISRARWEDYCRIYEELAQAKKW